MVTPRLWVIATLDVGIELARSRVNELTWLSIPDVVAIPYPCSIGLIFQNPLEEEKLGDVLGSISDTLAGLELSLGIRVE